MSYDIIGDLHGQAEKLKALLNTLGYRWDSESNLTNSTFAQGG